MQGDTGSNDVHVGLSAVNDRSGGRYDFNFAANTADCAYGDVCRRRDVNIAGICCRNVCAVRHKDVARSVHRDGGIAGAGDIAVEQQRDRVAGSGRSTDADRSINGFDHPGARGRANAHSVCSHVAGAQQCDRGGTG